MEVDRSENHFIDKSQSIELSKKHSDGKSSALTVSWRRNIEGHKHHVLHMCCICKTGFSTKHRLRNHERANHGMHQFACVFCKEGFQSKKQLINHVLVHKGTHGYRCEVCCKVRPNYIMMLRHLKTHAEKNIPCSDCGALFKTRWELKSHEIRHGKDRKFNCKFCGSTFVNHAQLRGHMTDHCAGGSSPGYEIGGKSLSTRENLMVNRLLHSNEKSFGCQYCSLKFPTTSARKKHVILHQTKRRNPLECEECGKVYTSTTSLAMHRTKLHVNGRPYRCQYCRLGFRSEEEVIEHGREHAGERPHSCKQCLCRYKNKRELRRHQREKRHFDSSGEWSENNAELSIPADSGHGVVEPEVRIRETDGREIDQPSDGFSNLEGVTS